jgi:peptide/nickel transport system substrate-binding protein
MSVNKVRGWPVPATALGLVLAVSACTGGGVGADPIGIGNEAPAGGPVPAGAHADGTYTVPDVPPGPAIVLAHPTPYTSYNSTVAGQDATGNTLVLNQVLADPFVLDGNGNHLLNADVMESVAVTSEDPQVVTYRIKPGITWSDGEPWDCDDFYLAWLAASGEAVVRDSEGEPVTDSRGEPRSYFHADRNPGAARATGRCVDDLTFVETYAAPFADWRGNYAKNAILPAHVVEQQTGVADITELTPQSPAAVLQRVAEFWNTGWSGFQQGIMPASGPYRIDGWEPNRSVTLSRNDRWAGNPGGPKRIAFRVFRTGRADGAQAAVRGLANQDLTVVVPPTDPVLAQRLRRLADQGVTFQVRAGQRVEHLDLNIAHPLLRDPAVRHAVLSCIDRDDITDTVTRRIDPDAQPVGSLAFLPDDRHYEDVYSDQGTGDAEQAKRILEVAGWTLGPDAVYTKDGQRLSLRISHPPSERYSAVVELIQLHCRAAGIQVIDDPDPKLEQRLQRGEYAAALLTTRRGPLLSSLASRYQTTGDRNHQSYSDPEVDKALELVQTESSYQARVEALSRADRLIAEDHATLPLFQVPEMLAYSDSISGVHPHGWYGVTWNAAEWEADGA